MAMKRLRFVGCEDSKHGQTCPGGQTGGSHGQTGHSGRQQSGRPGRHLGLARFKIDMEE